MNKTTITVVVIVLLIALWYFVSPLLFDDTVDEAFPIPSEEEMSEMSESERQELQDSIMEEARNAPDTVMDEEMDETSPTLLASAMFEDADSFHQGEGDAFLYELADGSRVVRFENFSVTNGPDLHVLLARNPSPGESDDLDEGYVELGKLKGNVGNQNYEIPSNVDLSAYGSIVIYCKPFHVIFSTATLE